VAAFSFELTSLAASPISELLPNCGGAWDLRWVVVRAKDVAGAETAAIGPVRLRLGPEPLRGATF
jgi:hypothetical protein